MTNSIPQWDRCDAWRFGTIKLKKIRDILITLCYNSGELILISDMISTQRYETRMPTCFPNYKLTYALRNALQINIMYKSLNILRSIYWHDYESIKATHIRHEGWHVRTCRQTCRHVQTCDARLKPETCEIITQKLDGGSKPGGMLERR